MTVDVTVVDIAALGAMLCEAERRAPRLSGVETQRRNRIADQASAQRYTAAHVALRLVLERQLGRAAGRAPFALGAHGKPSLAGSPASFSLAHSDRFALIAVSANGPVGVDIEEPRSLRLNPRLRALLIAAAQSIGPPFAAASMTDDQDTLRAWTRLEALAKASGLGIGAILGAVLGRDGRDRSPAVWLDSLMTDGRLRIEDLRLPFDGVIAALVLPAAETFSVATLLPDAIAAA